MNTNILLIVFVSLLLRILFLDKVPNGLWQDEATTGYDAYSISINLRNQYGDFLPLFSKAFGDYNESLYRFIVAPFIKIFDLSEFAIRLPAAIVGSLTVYALYCLAKESFNKKIALLAALLLAISPWHIVLSRIAFRAILFPCLFCVGLFLFLKGIKQPKYLLVSSFTFGISLYTYSSARVFVPVFLLCLVIIYWKNLLSCKSQTIISFLLFLGIFAFLCAFWVSSEGMTRANSVLILNPIKILHNYSSYFSPKFLFIEGDPNIRHSPTKIGQLYYLESLAVLIGILSLIKNISSQHNKKLATVLLLWLLLYPLPAALTAPAHALRSLIGAPLFSIISGYGIYQLDKLFNTQKKIYYFLISIALAVNTSMFINYYFVYDPKYNALEFWQYGLKEAISYVENSKYNYIFVSDKFNKLGENEPYKYIHVFIAFYSQYSSCLYQKNPIDPSVKSNYYLGKYYIGNTKNFLNNLKLEDRYLMFIRPSETGLVERFYKFQEIKVIKDPRNINIIKLIELKQKVSVE